MFVLITTVENLTKVYVVKKSELLPIYRKRVHAYISAGLETLYVSKESGKKLPRICS